MHQVGAYTLISVDRNIACCRVRSSTRPLPRKSPRSPKKVAGSGGKERKRLKEEVISELLPRASSYARHGSRRNLDAQDGWFVVDSASRRRLRTRSNRSARRSAASRPRRWRAGKSRRGTLMTDWRLTHGNLPADWSWG